ncbi:MAG: MmgE/PrpD family protein [Rhizobiales bacterium]|nr:MmgE/PrpD family protein [Hyphomicrobiales bacterium]
MTPTASERIARFATAFGPDRLTAPLRAACGRSLVDLHAAAIAGWDEPAAERVRRYCASLSGGAVDVVRLWRGGYGSLEGAALANGVAAHVLDYDDVSSPMRGHPGVAIWPALLALGEARKASGDQLASAFIVGFEVIVKLSRAMAVRHYARGWHSTSSIGTIGAAVACAYLLRLDATRAINAIGLAVAQAAGTRQNFGTDAKSFQAGQANAAGLRAALLAETGFSASPAALDGGVGYINLYGTGEDLAGQLAELGSAPLEIERSGVEVKKYPLCYATHRMLDGLLDLRAAHRLVLADVASIDIRVSRDALAPLIHHRPRSGLEAKFSMEYAAAAALLDGDVKLSSFLDSAVMRPEIQNFLPKVTASEQGETLMPRWAEMTVRRNDGAPLTTRIESLRGSAEKPLSDEEFLHKIQDCYDFGGCRIDAARFLDDAMRMDCRDVSGLLPVVA